MLLFLLPLISISSATPYGSKTLYSLVAGNLSAVKLACPAVALYALHRHGSRNVGGRHIQEFNNLTDTLRRRFDAEGYPAHAEWVRDFHHTHKDNKILVIEGFKELIAQGRAFGSRFPHLFYDAQSQTQFSTSSEQRCVESGLAYLYGVYGINYQIIDKDAVNTIRDMLDLSECQQYCDVFKPTMYGSVPNYNFRQVSFDPVNDSMMRYYKSCKKYAAIRETSEWEQNARKWLDSTQFRELVDHMRQSINLPNLSSDDVIKIHFLCSFENQIPRLMKSSHWCDLIPSEYIYTSAFYIDLVYMYKKMMPIVVEASCVLVQDALNSLKNNVKANINFGHRSTILPVLKYLGLLKKSMKYPNNNVGQDFWGNYSPIAAHLAFVAINCNGEIQVQAILNEKPIELPACRSPCKLSTLLEVYSKDTCNFEEICDEESFSYY